jgi:hypothetical protein
MPQQVRARLAKACQGLQLPSGGLVFEEDDKGDAMYVVVSGALQVRARPLQQAAAAQQQQQQQQQQQVPDSSAGTSPAPVLGHSSSGGSGSQLGVQASRRVRATTDAVCAGDGDSSSSGSGARGQLLGGGPRCATWEGVAFTAKEQSRLAAAQAAVETDKLQVGPGQGSLALAMHCIGGPKISTAARNPRLLFVVVEYPFHGKRRPW